MVLFLETGAHLCCHGTSTKQCKSPIHSVFNLSLSQFRKNFLRNFQKPIDKSPKMWYNIYSDKRCLG
uniref:Uncharacterized protein n=1 Tax=Siphoviridae sp. ctBCr48 TaxID=2827802 RepID=A0A8S5SHT6_9CAUD|nr:MAG TPA: hypothetical protein [Siphoviridae sp. ctBCr48]